MKTIMEGATQDSLSFSRRYFNWRKKPADDDGDEDEPAVDPSRTLPHSRSVRTPRKKISLIAVSKLRAALERARARTRPRPRARGRVVGTLFGHRRGGHVRLTFQEDFKLGPAFLVELSTPTAALLREMASGLVRIALECDKRGGSTAAVGLEEEPVWRAYCNGKKCGYAVRRDCGPEEWRVLNSIGPISMGAGVLPGVGAEEEMGEMMYMRAKFERVVGNRDSEAFYMMNPDGKNGGGGGGPELSIYLLRV